MAASKERIQRIEELIRRAEALPDQGARTVCVELVQAVMELHGAGLERMLDMLLQAEAGPAILRSLTGDDLASSLLLLHGLHPDPLETRIERAVEKLRPFLRSRGADVVLVGIEDGVVRVRMEGNHSAAEALRRTVEEAIYGAGPDVVDVAIETPEAFVFVPLASLRAA